MNILAILLTFLVLNDVKSNDFNEEQPKNISDILLTLLVSNLDKSIDFNEVQNQNIKLVFVNLVLNLNLTFNSFSSLISYLKSNLISYH